MKGFPAVAVAEAESNAASFTLPFGLAVALSFAARRLVVALLPLVTSQRLRQMSKEKGDLGLTGLGGIVEDDGVRVEASDVVANLHEIFGDKKAHVRRRHLRLLREGQVPYNGNVARYHLEHSLQRSPCPTKAIEAVSEHVGSSLISHINACINIPSLIFYVVEYLFGTSHCVVVQVDTEMSGNEDSMLMAASTPANDRIVRGR